MSLVNSAYFSMTSLRAAASFASSRYSGFVYKTFVMLLSAASAN